MIIPDQRLSGDDTIIDKDGSLVVIRPITLSICRCRECKDACKTLSEPKYSLCCFCNNDCSQKADPNNSLSEWLGPFTGPRKK